MENRTEIYYFDEKGNPVKDAEKASSVKIRELDKDGSLVKETTMKKVTK